MYPTYEALKVLGEILFNADTWIWSFKVKRVFLALLIGLMLSISFGTISYAADPSLVLYLSFNEGAGKKVTDGSQYGNHGVINAGNWTEGKYGKAIEFDMKTSDVRIPDSDSLDLTDAFTLAAWIKGKPDQEGWTRIGALKNIK